MQISSLLLNTFETGLFCFKIDLYRKCKDSGTPGVELVTVSVPFTFISRLFFLLTAIISSNKSLEVMYGKAKLHLKTGIKVDEASLVKNNNNKE